jgi:hypothetical protein
MAFEKLAHAADITMEKTIARLGTELIEVPLEASKYIKPRSVLYTMDGMRQVWCWGGGCPSVTVAT